MIQIDKFCVFRVVVIICYFFCIFVFFLNFYVFSYTIFLIYKTTINDKSMKHSHKMIYTIHNITQFYKQPYTHKKPITRTLKRNYTDKQTMNHKL